MKKEWNLPELLELSVEKTELGNSTPTVSDSSYSDGVNTWWSFS